MRTWGTGVSVGKYEENMMHSGKMGNGNGQMRKWTKYISSRRSWKKGELEKTRNNSNANLYKSI